VNASAAQQQNPEAEYQSRLEQLRAAQSVYKIKDARLAWARFALLFGGTLLGVWLIVTKTHSIFWIAIPVALFIISAVAHERVIRALRDSTRKIAFYERRSDRLNNRWMGKGQKGERFLDPVHPYARDLDIFGEGSLFELLCTSRTRAGEETLARWLLAPADTGEVKLRQGAVVDLRDRLGLREDLALLNEEIDAGVRPEALAVWGEQEASVVPVYVRFVLPLLAALWIASFVVWAVWDLWYFAAAMTVINAFIANGLNKRISERISSMDAALRDLPLLSAVLARFERESFSSPKLTATQAALRAEGRPASRRIANLAKLAESLASRRNLIVKAVDRFVFWTLQFALAIESWRKRFGPEVRGWLAALGEIEALSDLAGYAYEHPNDTFAEFSETVPCFEAADFAHPLIPESAAVRNDLALGEDLRLVIISGPNMAGKSTFVRAVGMNAVLAQCGAPVRARKLRISALNVAASVCVLDSLQGGVSRFYAEITRLRLIMDMAQKPVPVLYLLDELLSGTNSHDRRIGAEAIVRGLFQRNAVGLVTTHDLALAEIASNLGNRAANVHFEDHLEAGELRFNYRLTPGIVHTSNALELMRSIGLDV
jgi:hypothetical protein